MLERRSHAMDKLDRYRRILTWEPRGHADMYGGWVGPPVREDSHVSVLFVHNSGFSTMCGHGIIALIKVLIDTQVVAAKGSRTTVLVDTPAGQVKAVAETEDGIAGPVEFDNVASFAAELDRSIQVDGLGRVIYDLAFGGAFYAYVEAASVGLPMDDVYGLIDAGRRIKARIAESLEIAHPESAELGFLYGVVFTGPPRDPANSHRSVCVFADGEVDRSPTGTGVSGSLAILRARGEIQIGERITVESIVGSVFGGKVGSDTEVGGIPAVVPKISGTAHITGRSEFWVDPEDPLAAGFFIR